MAAKDDEPKVTDLVLSGGSTDVGVLEFDILTGRLAERYEGGYVTAQDFLATWDWPAYPDPFR